MPILRWFALFAFGLIAIGGCGSGGGGDNSGPEASWTYVGTWVSHGDGSDGAPVKIVLTADRMDMYKKDSGATPWGSASLTVDQDWVADGGHYFRCLAEYALEGGAGNGCVLMRVSGNNNTLEGNTSASTTCPTAITPNQGQYGIWTRQQ